MALDLFDSVRQFDSLRQSLGQSMPAMPKFEMPDIAQEMGRMPMGLTAKPQGVGRTTQGTKLDVGHFQGDGHNHGKGGSTIPLGKLNLASFAGRQFDAAVIPQIQKLQQAFPGMRITSGYRDPERNRKANGAKNSWHLKGRAVDLVGSAGDMQRGAAWARQNGAREILVHNAGSGQHLHVAW